MSARRRWLLPAGVFLYFTVTGLSRFAHFWLDDLARNRTDTLHRRLIEELTGGYSSALVVLVLVWVVSRYPLERGRVSRRLPGYIVLVVLLGLVHTTLMWLSRELIFPLVGMGHYDYGIMAYRYPMEFATQAPDLVFVIAVLHAWRYYRRLRERELQAVQLEGELNRARLERLEAQLQPHFLFNTLNAISSLMYSDPTRADRMMGRLSDLLRLTFEPAPATEVALSSELEWLEWYLEIMQLRFGDRLTVHREIAPAAQRLTVPRLLLQPLVENALKHGAAKRAGPSTVTIAACLEGDRLRLSVGDDGPGLAGDPAQAFSAGIGLSNTAARLRARYGDRASLRLENQAGGGLLVTLDLPAEAA
jgi:LytS/YehU family sensor histidine kinase